jgi:hypothetical protein
VSWVAWLIVVQVLLVAGFIASTVVFLLGILQRVQPPAPVATPASDDRAPRTVSLRDNAHRWRVVDAVPETITG